MTDTELWLLLNAAVLPVAVRALLELKPLRDRSRIRAVALCLLLLLDLTLVLWLDCSRFGLAYFAVLACLTALASNASLQQYTELLGRGRLPLYLGSVATIAFVAYVHLPITTFL